MNIFQQLVKINDLLLDLKYYVEETSSTEVSSQILDLNQNIFDAQVCLEKSIYSAYLWKKSLLQKEIS